ncbi:hypothetical protein TNIN_317191 [Trichonephila inaurata madagascariensis]|uniref:Uncharacterized protein n=1 Tax=Trichonephila inaurata madagascariensis TaxID=2747483 RepID=A0A8X6IF13_9ARAC|nr:hypothetical protein TNIN_317191 [Trichonephila inaurata madagascariensis]
MHISEPSLPELWPFRKEGKSSLALSLHSPFYKELNRKSSSSSKTRHQRKYSLIGMEPKSDLLGCHSYLLAAFSDFISKLGGNCVRFKRI